MIEAGTYLPAGTKIRVVDLHLLGWEDDPAGYEKYMEKLGEIGEMVMDQTMAYEDYNTITVWFGELYDPNSSLKKTYGFYKDEVEVVNDEWWELWGKEVIAERQ